MTAAHCLRRFPEPRSVQTRADYPIYKDLLGPLGAKERNVWAECLYADPISDVALLGCPTKEEELTEFAVAYKALTEAMPTLRVGKPPSQGELCWFLGLDSQWAESRIEGFNRGVLFLEGNPKLRVGLSGGPILRKGGSAIALVAAGPDPEHIVETDVSSTQPVLVHNLPGWLQAH